jgi:hypothetical protein
MFMLLTWWLECWDTAYVLKLEVAVMPGRVELERFIMIVGKTMAVCLKSQRHV